MVTFDGQRFVFEGSCEYILATVRPWRGGATGATRRPWEDSGAPGGLLLSAPSPQDGCGTNDSQPTFKILTENVVCGKSGVTCSRAIRMSLGVSGLVGVPSRQPPGARSGPLGAASACCPSASSSTQRAAGPGAGRGVGSLPEPWLSPQLSVHDVLEPPAEGRLERTGPAQSWPSAGAVRPCP